MIILILDPFHPSLPEKLSRFGEVTSDPGRLKDATVALVRSKTKCTAQWMDQAPKLELIVRGGVGLDNIDLEAAKARGIAVRNTPEASSVAVAELAMALLLALANPLVQGHLGMKQGKWLKKELKRRELFGKTLGLLGIGRIGNEVARRAAAFGMKIAAYDPYVKAHDLVRLVDLEELAAGSDFLSLHVPLTDQTRGMVNADLIARMKDGVGIVNTCRGGVIDEEAVAAALESGKIGGYATDVWLSDPPDPSSPILKAPNTVLLPHIGASTEENLLRIGEIIERILEEFSGK